MAAAEVAEPWVVVMCDLRSRRGWRGAMGSQQAADAASVDPIDRAGDERGGVGGEEGDDVGDLVWLADPAEGEVPLGQLVGDRRLRGPLVHLSEVVRDPAWPRPQRRPDRPGRDRVDPHAGAAL